MSASTPASRPADDTPTLASRHTGLLMAATMCISICQFLDMTIANVALPHMRTSLGATMESISWVLTSFIIAGALVLPLTGWLADRLGSRNLFIGATLLFVISSMLCGAATSLTEMVIYRALQGASSAFIGPLSQTIVIDINRPSRQAQAMSIWGMAVMLGPISGPFLGGFLTEYFNWRWVFYVNLPLGIPALVILWWLLPSRPIVKRRLDVFGAAALAFALCALQLMLDRGQSKDWFESREVVVELLIALSAFWMFIVHTKDVRHPLFPKDMFRDPNLLVGIAFTLVIGLANVALSAVLPTMYQTIYGYSVMDTGSLIAPRGLGVFVTMVAVNRLMGRMDARLMISLGYAVVAFSLWMMTRWSLNMDWHLIVISSFIQGLGLGFIFVPTNLVAFSSLHARFRTDASTLLTLVRNLGGSFGISVIVTTLARNIQISHSDISASVTSFSVPGFDPASTASLFGSVGDGILAMLDAEVNRQAAMIAYLNNFYMLFWLVLCFVPLAWVIKRPNIMRGQPHVQSE